MIETNTSVNGAILPDSSLMTERLGSHVIVDIGTIQSVGANGYATVTTGRTKGGEVITYSNVEVLYIGNRLGAIQVSPAGSICLLICPKTVMPSSDTGEVIYTVPHYSVSGMKAIPLTHASDTKCYMGITPSGSITFSGGTFSATIGTEGVHVYSNEGTTQFRIDKNGGVTQSYGKGIIRKFIGPDGSINEVRFADDGKVMYFEKYELSGATTIKRVSEGPVKLSELNSYDKWAMVNTYLPDGTVTDDTNNNTGLVVRDANGNIVSTLTLASTGNSTLMGKNEVKLDCMNTDDASQASVLLDTGGNITITAMKTLNIDIARGKFTLSVDDQGALSISASSGVEITDASGNKITTSSTGIELASSAGTSITLGSVIQIG